MRATVLWARCKLNCETATYETALDCSELFEYDGEGPRHDLHVLPEGLVADVFEVKTQFATDVVDALIVAMIHLRPPRDAGAHALALAVAVDLLAQPPDDRGVLGARPHDVHFPPQHVEQLGQFVEAVETQDASHRGDARIVGAGPHLPGLRGPCGGRHRAEFVDAERPSAAGGGGARGCRGVSRRRGGGAGAGSAV